MEIKQVSTDEVGEFHSALSCLIRSTMQLPDVALDHYTHQWSELKLKTCLDSWLFLVAKENDKIAGLVLATPVEGGVGTIIWLLVDSDVQKKGLGTSLFNEACKIYKSKGAHKLKLTVPDESTTSFYIKQGMILEGIHRKHWWKNDFWAMGIQL
ncbi:hypothetical protein BH09BAC3_BH09BAC3_13160 [soil metagenome]